MLRIIGQRLVFLLGVVIGVSVVTFLISHVIPGDPARLMAGPRASPELIARIRAQLGLDQPLPVQYVHYLANIAHLNFGRSIVTGQPVIVEFVQRIPATLELMGTAMVFSIVLGVGLGLIAALYRDSWVDHLVRSLAVVSISVPTFWLGLLLIVVLYGKLGILPASGRIGGVPPTTITGFYLIDSLITANFAAFGDALSHLILPAVTLAIAGLGGVARIVRASMIEVMREDYVLTARASGLKERVVVINVALRNALIPFVTYLGLWIASLLYGSVIVETVFSWPGTGKYVVDAIFNLDFPVVMAFTLIVSIAYVVVNLFVDLAYMALDPQIREVG